ncbi:SNF7 family protein [Actinidia rufa]|uniref:SNF7 family protein n=1 Tax=Actinidia rufa TaxID=165716 RepID=A0A7J0FS40_9ERIC|nr:SNF7 family protein [Actinidia rufa]
MKTVKIQDRDSLQDKMLDLMHVSNEIQESLGRNYNVLDGIDEENLTGGELTLKRKYAVWLPEIEDSLMLCNMKWDLRLKVMGCLHIFSLIRNLIWKTCRQHHQGTQQYRLAEPATRPDHRLLPEFAAGDEVHDPPIVGDAVGATVPKPNAAKDMTLETKLENIEGILRKANRIEDYMLDVEGLCLFQNAKLPEKCKMPDMNWDGGDFGGEGEGWDTEEEELFYMEEVYSP